MVFILTRWVGASLINEAKREGERAGVPVVGVPTANFIPEVLRKYGLLKEQDEEPKAQNQQPPKTRSSQVDATQQEKESEFAYVQACCEKAIEVIRSALSPGEKRSEEEILNILEAGMSLSREWCKKVMDELHAQGVLVNTVGATWKLRGEEDEYEEDLEEVPNRKVRSKGSRGELALLVAGLPEGPYATKAEIRREMLKYKEFMNLDGGEPSRAWLDLVLKEAEKLGILVTCPEKGWKVRHEEGFPLTFREEVSKELVVVEKAPKKKREKYVSLSELQEEGEENELEKGRKLVSRVRVTYGEDPPWEKEGREAARRIRRMVPIEYWDECAAREVCKRLKVEASWKDFLRLREYFDDLEWDFLAWETVKELPVKVLTPWLRKELEDMVLPCVGCGKQFLFSASEQEFMERKFGAIRPPRKCKVCRRAKKGGNLS